MDGVSVQRLLDALSVSQVVWGAIWTGLGFLTCALLVLLRTRWGQSKPLRKCAVLSVWAHLLMATYAMTVPIVVGSSAPVEEPVFTISTVEQYEPNAQQDDAARDQPLPWERFHSLNAAKPDTVALARADSGDSSPLERQAPTVGDPLPDAVEPSRPRMIEPEEPEVDLAASAVPLGNGDTAAAAVPIEAPAATRREPTPNVVPRHGELEREEIAADSASQPNRYQAVSTNSVDELPDVASAAPSLAEQPTTADPTPAVADLVDTLAPPTMLDVAAPLAPVMPSVDDDNTTQAASNSAAGDLGPSQDERVAAGSPGDDDLHGNQPGDDGHNAAPPSTYRLRTAPNRRQLAQSHGGSPESEAAVEAALRWLADHQSEDGRWNPAELEGGRELAVGGRNRRGTGANADTGVTGLAVLAFLGAGHTHLQGRHQDTVRGGLEFLLDSQATDGNLSGHAGTYAAMYCHGMATLALCEAYGMTKDERLEAAVRRAVKFTIDAQHSVTGGWRYRPGDLGDTSQLGWQVLVLRSAQIAGIAVPDETRNGAIRFLRSVSSGTHGGLASYRPGEAVSRPMTAEALYCRQILGMRRDNPAGSEAADYLIEQLPGDGQANLYYWYYATLALFQWQGDQWQRWNHAMQETLVSNQVKVGRTAGSWEPDTVWSGYGGRAYSTAMGALCLEVYYRFLPLYAEAAADHPRLK